MDEQKPPPGVDVSRPDVARMYDFYLGGTFNWEVDREAAERVMAIAPEVRDAAWGNRGFLQRASSWMAKQGIDQFLDVGAGLPTMNNTHDVVHEVNPGARVIYVDASPEVVTQGLRMIGNVDGVHYIAADLRSPSSILEHETVVRYLDFSRPIGLMLVGVLYFLDEPASPAGALIDAVPSGSYVAISHLTRDGQDAAVVDGSEEIYSRSSENIHFRKREDIEAILAAPERSTLELLPPYEGGEPGLCWVGQWGSEDPVAADDDPGRWLYAGVAAKRDAPS